MVVDKFQEPVWGNQEWLAVFVVTDWLNVGAVGTHAPLSTLNELLVAWNKVGSGFPPST